MQRKVRKCYPQEDADSILLVKAGAIAGGVREEKKKQIVLAKLPAATRGSPSAHAAHFLFASEKKTGAAVATRRWCGHYNGQEDLTGNQKQQQGKTKTPDALTRDYSMI